MDTAASVTVARYTSRCAVSSLAKRLAKGSDEQEAEEHLDADAEPRGAR